MNSEISQIYKKLGIKQETLEFGLRIEDELSERFKIFDETAEYNQLKVLHAMQENRVSEGCFQYASGYGYNDMGRDTLEAVYASAFHTESALVRQESPSIKGGIPVRAMSCSPRSESLTTHWKK